MSTILGNWTVDWGKFGQQYGVHTLDELALSTMPEVPGIPFQRPADDFRAHMTKRGLAVTATFASSRMVA